MTIREISARTEELLAALTALWEASVRSSHDFLSEEEILKIKEYVPQALAAVPHLLVAEDESQSPLGFMGIDGPRLEMLFLSPETIGKGLGKALIELGIERYGVCEVTVNEQNPKAKSFYEHMGFTTYKRTDKDEQGAPYPLLYMKRTT